MIRDRESSHPNRTACSRLNCRIQQWPHMTIRLSTSLLLLAMASVLAAWVSSKTLLATEIDDECRTGEWDSERQEFYAFMRTSHLNPFLQLNWAVREKDYVDADRALCRMLGATDLPSGRRIISLDLSQEQFEKWMHLRGVVSRGRLLARSLRKSPNEIADNGLRDTVLDIGAACQNCHRTEAD